MELVWTRLALLDRQSIRNFIAADKPQAALDFDERLAARAARLVEQPRLGRRGRVLGTLELVLHRNYILVYELTASRVRVLRILHAARAWPPSPR